MNHNRRDQKTGLQFALECLWCHRICKAVEYITRDNEPYTLVDGDYTFFVACEMTGFKLKYVCNDCKGVFMGFAVNKERFEKDLETFDNLPPKKQDMMLKKWQLRLTFEIYGELSSLSHSYKEMLKLIQGREVKKDAKTSS